MSKSRIGKAGLASLAVTGLIGSSLLMVAGTANAVPGFEFDRIAGGDRFGTSALVAEQIGDGANAILANGQRGQFADALAANYLAGDLDAPVYLTRQNSTPDSIADQLEANEVENITIVGGEGAVSAAQAAALTADGYTVNRISGANRFETNAEIIEAVGGAPEDTALVATGLNFSDALAGGPLAENGHPLALASQNGVPDAVIDALETSGVDNAIIVGGESAVGAGAVADLEAAGIDVITRLSGTGRADTSVAVAEYGVANLGLTDTAVNLASGDVEGSGADALSGGVLTGQQGRPLLITQTVNNPSNAVRDYIEENSDTLTEGTIFGGNAAVSAATQTELEALGQGTDVPPPNDNLNITPQEDVQLGEEETRQYTVSDLDPAEEYRVTIVDANNFTEDADGDATFADENNDGFADPGTLDSELTVVNGVPNNQTPNSAGGISPNAAGVITFTVTTGNDVEEFAPVVYTDEGGNDTRLNVDEDGVPEEPYGVGGSIQVVPDEAGQGVFGPDEVLLVDKAADNFVTADALYNYDSNDNYFIAGDPTAVPAIPDTEVTQAEFEAELSVGDSVSGDYRENPALVSTFVLQDDEPTPPVLEQPAAADISDDSVTLTVDETSLNDDFDTVTVYGEEEDAQGNVDTVDTEDSEVFATATEDADADEDGFQIVVDGLTAETDYAFAATQTVEDEESELSNEVDVTTDPTADPITINTAVLTEDEVVEGEVDTDDVWTLTFSDDLDAATVGDTLNLRAANGATFIVECGLAVDATDNITAATCTVDGDELTIEILEPAERRNAGDDEPTYPATITATDGIEGADAGQDEVDLAGSADVVVD